jgi:ABC-type glycerol-3-phosphate transport system substrate-binding protein
VLRVALLALAVLALAACGGDEAATPEASSAGEVQELANVLDLRADFEADAGKPRLLFLFSPT